MGRQEQPEMLRTEMRAESNVLTKILEQLAKAAGTELRSLLVESARMHTLSSEAAGWERGVSGPFPSRALLPCVK